MLGVQTLSCLCLASWGFTTSVILLWMINKVVTIRMEVHHEFLGADLTEHHVRHGKVYVFYFMSSINYSQNGIKIISKYTFFFQKFAAANCLVSIGILMCLVILYLSTAEQLTKCDNISEHML